MNFIRIKCGCVDSVAVLICVHSTACPLLYFITHLTSSLETCITDGKQLHCNIMFLSAWEGTTQYESFYAFLPNKEVGEGTEGSISSGGCLNR